MFNHIIRSRAPLRLGLAGGGTDVSPYCDTYGGAILNVTIDKYAYASLKPSPDGKVVFNSIDLNTVESFDGDALIPDAAKLALHRGVYNRIMTQYNGGKPIPLVLSTHVDAPMGSGLGSSSALVVAMVAAFCELLSIPLGEYEIARLAFDIERVDLGLSGGRQDQYAATFGGFNFMEFSADERVVVNPLRIRSHVHNELESSILMTFTGASRESAKIINAQSKSVSSGGSSLDAMHQLKLEATQMKEALLFGSMRKVADILQSGWEAKKRTSPAVSTREVEELFSLVLGNGAMSGKLSGAGGGGFAMFIVDPDRRHTLQELIKTRTTATPVIAKLIVEGVTTWTSKG
ncbi:dehydrogenase [Asticcacaulis sp. YBE204]|uniref:GHMP family kinase ATP-binding protein n=1 Tax=Asticcacaulis sp. YBE204 TaxID=1282363 RepID=UPI0003C3D09B|nr:dehydrogenase [Asticcacaulis sp. YBE204]ESQ80747.1 dehydrogenase [Asticcacaulis sp. YBE204]